MIIVETPLKTLEGEIQKLGQLAAGPNGKTFVLGALNALMWVKAGGPPPSAAKYLMQAVETTDD